MLLSRKRKEAIFLVDFVGMVDVQHQRALQTARAQPGEQLPVDARGDDHGQPGVDTQAANVGDRLDLPGEPGEQGIARGQWIAAAVDHLGDRGIGRDIVQRALPLPAPGGIRRVIEMAAKAVAAVDGAGRAREQQDAAVVLVDQPGHRIGRLLVQRIRAIAGHLVQLAGGGEYLEQQWIGGVAAAHPRHVGTRYAQRELRGRPGGDAEGRGVEVEQRGKLQRIANRLGELRLPGARLPRRDALLYHGGPRSLGTTEGNEWPPILPVNFAPA